MATPSQKDVSQPLNVDNSTSFGPSQSPTKPTESKQSPSEELLQSVRQQLDQCMTMENLMKDCVLASCMDSAMWIPATAMLLNSPAVRTLTGGDVNVLLQAALLSDQVTVDLDTSMIRPKLKHNRNTLMLRDIQPETKENDIRAMFSNTEHEKECVSVTADINNTWFVTFQTESAATEAVLWLRTQTFKGEPVKASIRAEQMLRSRFSPAAGLITPPQATNMHQRGGRGGIPAAATSTNHATIGIYNPYNNTTGLIHPSTIESAPSGYYGQFTRFNGRHPYNRDFSVPYYTKFPGIAMNANLPAGVEDNLYSVDSGRRGRGGRVKRRSDQRAHQDRGHAARATQSAASIRSDHQSPAYSTLKVNAENFPPLQVTRGGAEKVVPVTNVGYTGTFRKYGVPEIRKICNEMPTVEVPPQFQLLEKEDPSMSGLFTLEKNFKWAAEIPQSAKKLDSLPSPRPSRTDYHPSSTYHGSPTKSIPRSNAALRG
eukprot:GHVL01010893.1.p1 GENE.GHVL01010893.1~~GHVL01010893.1.p1  ORF type:complete len:486 (+),score=64.19 GHVL01010893.1:62-1519(+)